MLNEYPLNDSDLRDLTRTGAGATIFLSIGSICIGTWSSLNTILPFAESLKLPAATVAAWTERHDLALIGALVCYGLAAILIFSGFTRIEEIKASVRFGQGDDYQAKKWVTFIVWLILIVIVFAAGVMTVKRGLL